MTSLFGNPLLAWITMVDWDIMPNSSIICWGSMAYKLKTIHICGTHVWIIRSFAVWILNPLRKLIWNIIHYCPMFSDKCRCCLPSCYLRTIETMYLCLRFTVTNMLSNYWACTLGLPYYCPSPIYCDFEALKLNSGRHGLVWPVGWRVFMWRVESTNTDPIKQNEMPDSCEDTDDLGKKDLEEQSIQCSATYFISVV